jgi:hypothetical protein
MNEEPFHERVVYRGAHEAASVVVIKRSLSPGVKNEDFA